MVFGLSLGGKKNSLDVKDKLKDVESWAPGKEVSYIKKDDGSVWVANTGKEYPIMQESDFLSFRTLCDDTSAAWKLAFESKDHVYVWDRPSEDKNSAINMVKMFAVFPDISPSVMYDCLHDHEYRKVWDSAMVQGYNICHLDANNDIGYYQVKLPMGVTNRDFCNERSWREFGNGEFIIMNHSEPHDACPPTKAVRGVSIKSGYLVRPHGKGCSLTYVSHSDPKGWLPTKLINMVVTNQGPNLVRNLREVSKNYPQWKKENNPDARPWKTPEQPWSNAPDQSLLEWYAKQNDTTMDEILASAQA